MFADTASSVTRATIGGFGTLFFAGLCLAGAMVPARADATTADVVQVARTETVRTADLNLAAPAGRHTLEQRIEAAARRVCDTQPGDLASRSLRAKCLKDAIADARAQMSMTVASAN